jgi:iron uptake system EfeUOB component EfeO/EfeM
VEWEILEGVMVVEEKENIAPGFVQKLKANLKAGQYDMTCGLLSNPKGKIVVTEAKGRTQSHHVRSNEIATIQRPAIAAQTNSR